VVLVLITLSSILDQGIDSTDFGLRFRLVKLSKSLPLVLGWANCRDPITAAQFKLGTQRVMLVIGLSMTRIRVRCSLM